jgi:hypothetical protein
LGDYLKTLKSKTEETQGDGKTSKSDFLELMRSNGDISKQERTPISSSSKERSFSDDCLSPLTSSDAKSPRVLKYRRSIDASIGPVPPSDPCPPSLSRMGSFDPVPPNEPCPASLSRKGSVVREIGEVYRKGSRGGTYGMPQPLNISTDTAEILKSVIIATNILPTPLSAIMDEPQTPVESRASYTSQSSISIQPDSQSPRESKKKGTFYGLRSILTPLEMSTDSAVETSSPPSILELDGELLGQQFGLIEQKLFKSIPLHEFFCQGWNDKVNLKSPNLQKLIAWFNSVALGMASEVVRQNDIKMRVSVVKKLITTAQSCLTYSNYNSCFEIVAGLNMASISRLKKTWKALPKKYLETFEYLNQIVSNESMLLTSLFINV